MVLCLRYLFPQSNVQVEELALADYFETPDDNEIIPGSRWQGGTRSGIIRNKMVDINKCDSSTLEALPGIGPVLAARIIKYRNLLGGFAFVDQLKEVYGLPEETYNLLSGKFIADSTDIKKIAVNSAGYRQLIRLPYLSSDEVNALLRYREKHGNIRCIHELIENGLLNQEKTVKVRHYLDFK